MAQNVHEEVVQPGRCAICVKQGLILHKIVDNLWSSWMLTSYFVVLVFSGFYKIMTLKCVVGKSSSKEVRKCKERQINILKKRWW